MRIARQTVKVSLRQHRFRPAGIADADDVAGFGVTGEADRRAVMVVHGEFNIDFTLFRANGAYGVGAHQRAYGVCRPDRAIFGQAR